jgi:6-pyruvoyltetrahydropterin/6-carboxytetrahydropterin synthase
MTLFPDGTKERLHGHNYRVGAALEMQEGFLDFARVKSALATLCEELREHLLMPSQSAAVRVLSQDEISTEFSVCGKRYVIPSDELLWLPMQNVVVEGLAEYLWGRIAQHLRAEFEQAGVGWLEVTVTEAPGQGARFRADPRKGG